MISKPTAEQLEFPRASGRQPTAAIVYRAVRLSVRLFGERRTFAYLADLARFSHRMAYESAGRLLGDDAFHGAALALDEETLRLAIPSSGSVLDIGCGNGRWCRAAAPFASRVVGIDRNPNRLALARERTSAPNVEFVQGDVRDGVSQGPFDVALLVHVVEHLDEPDPFLDHMHAVARRLLVEVPDFEGDPVNLARLNEGRSFASDADHVREFTEPTLVALMARNGWRVAWARKRGGCIVALAHGEKDPAEAS